MQEHVYLDSSFPPPVSAGDIGLFQYNKREDPVPEDEYERQKTKTSFRRTIRDASKVWFVFIGIHCVCACVCV